MSNAMTDADLNEDIDRARTVERCMAEGTKLPPDELEWYLSYKAKGFHDTWRHIESDTVYEWVGLGLAATGNGKLVLMVHYVPHGRHGPKFERQHAWFLERFEKVRPRTVWDRS